VCYAPNYRHDVAATIRFQINPHWQLKLEGHYLRGTAELNRTLNELPPAQLTRDWGLFLAKTTVYF
jgi:hypothetical protein